MSATTAGGRTYRMKPCPECDGSGRVPGPPAFPVTDAARPGVVCLACCGEGEVRKYPPRPGRAALSRSAARLAAKDAAITRLAHDLRGGLAGIVSMAEMIERDLERGRPERALERTALLRGMLRVRKGMVDAAELAALEE